MEEFNSIEFDITEKWKILINSFVDLEPDNNFEIDEIWHNFDEDLYYATFNDYFIDLGFYGDYLKNRRGFFKLYVAKGDFIDGYVFEIFITRKKDEIKEKIQKYINLISNDSISKLKYEKYTNGIGEIKNFTIYSSLENIKIKYSESEIETMMKD